MRKGQTALEYLITYGWAILIILVVLAVLWYYGVFDPSRWAGESANCPSSFSVLDYDLAQLNASAGTGTLTLVLGNTVGNRIKVTGIVVSGDAVGTGSFTTELAPNADGTFNVSISSGLTGSTGDLYDLDAAITYDDLRTGLTGKSVTCDIKKKL